ncbi:MAG: PilZ domain-containing protein, partial [Polyangiales bacterium]
QRSPASAPPSQRSPSSAPPSQRSPSQRPSASAPVEVPTSLLPPPAPIPGSARQRLEANLGATTQSNFYVGFSGEIAHGGVFLATYEAFPKDTSVRMLVTLPGGFEFECDGYVRFVRDPMDFASESEPGMGIQFEGLSEEARELVMRFIRKRPPIFYDV